MTLIHFIIGSIIGFLLLLFTRWLLGDELGTMAMIAVVYGWTSVLLARTGGVDPWN